MNVVTLTLSPAFDIHCEATKIRVNCENIASIKGTDAGGKGVNISRALRAFGIDSLAVVVLGNENSGEFLSALSRDGILYSEIKVEGRIRENITLHTADGKETRLSFEGDTAPADLMDRVREITEKICDENTVLTLTGRVPQGVFMEEVKSYVKALIRRGVKVVIDSRSFSLLDIIELRPFLIKPNEEEIAEYIKKPVSSIDDALSAARLIFDKGVENVMISLGSKGAVMVSDDGEFSVSAPKINVLSTIGAGDSSIAGFLTGVAEGKGSLDRLKYAVAFGSAACLMEGTKPPKKADIARILKQL